MLTFRLGEGCTRVAWLLFSLENIVDSKANELSWTSKHCEWSKPGKRKRELSRVNEINFKKGKYGDETPASNGKNKTLTSSVNAKGFLNTLTNTIGGQNAVVFDLMAYDSNNDANAVCSDLNVSRYEDITITEEVIRDSDPYLDLETIIKNKQVNLEGYTKMSNISKEIQKDVEERTRGQRNNVLWKRDRNMRITATSFHDVYVRKTDNEKSCDNLVSKLCSVDSEDSLGNIPAIIWGREHEHIAIKKKYIAV